MITCSQYSAQYNLTVLQPLTGISLNTTEIQLDYEDTYSLTVNYLPQNTTADKTVYWYSTQSDVAIVDDHGKVTGKGPGKAQIHAMVEDKDVYCTVTVKVPIQSVILNTTTGTMRLDRTKQLEMIFTPANTSDSKTVVWKSANSSVASVSNTGLVTAVSKGKTTITGTVLSGTAREMSATYTVTVIGLKDNKTGIMVVNSDDTEMDNALALSVEYINDSQNFENVSSQVQQAAGDFRMEEIQIYDISLKKSNESVQPEKKVDVEIPVAQDMVDDDTVVYRLETNGTLTDMEAAYDNGRYVFDTDHFSVYVLGKKKPVTKVENILITPGELTICPGKSGSFSVTILPENADNPSVNWSSSNEQIATVSENGKITAVSEGIATITATAKDGSEVKTTARAIISHTWNNGKITKEPTCTQAGVKTYNCAECGDTKTEEIAILAHDLLEHKAVEATCLEAGNNAYWSCERCGRYFDDENGETEIEENSWVIEAPGHKYEVTVTEPTCTERGYTTYTCTQCSESYVDNYTEATGHSWGEAVVVKEATYDEDGELQYTCSKCGETKTEKVFAKKHVWSDGTITKNPTCTEPGVRTYTCSECDEIRTEDIPAIGHDYHEQAVAATCTERGYTEHICGNCGDSYRDNYIEAPGHSWDAGKVTKEATCTEDGLKIYTCGNCGGTKEEAIPAINHDYGEWVSTGPQNHQRICRHNTSHTETEAHTWDGGKITQQPTDTSPGIRTFTCTKCGAIRTEEMQVTIDSVNKMISSIPDKLSLQDAEFVHAAMAAFRLLTEEEQGRIADGALYKLMEAEKTILALEEQAEKDKEAANAVIVKINSISATISLSDEAKIAQTRDAFNNLTVEQKKLVSQALQKKLTDAATVLEAIKTISNANTNDPASVEKARKAYNSLSDDQKKLVNQNTVTQLEQKESSLKPKESTETPKDVKVNMITISGISHKIAAGKNIKLTASVLPVNASNKQVKWTSSNSKIATVTQNGLVKIKKKASKSVVITATAADGSKVSATWKIKPMKGAVKKITVKGAKKTLKVGSTMKLKAVVKVTKGKSVNKTLKWTSSNTKWATVSKSGKVKAQKGGKGKTVKITVTSTDGTNKKVTKKIKIK